MLEDQDKIARDFHKAARLALTVFPLRQTTFQYLWYANNYTRVSVVRECECVRVCALRTVVCICITLCGTHERTCICLHMFVHAHVFV